MLSSAARKIAVIFFCLNFKLYSSESFNPNFDNQAETNLTTEKISSLKPYEPAWGKDALKIQPLIIESKELSLLVFVTNKGLRAVDLKTEQILWEIFVPAFTFAAPVYSADKKTLYYLTRQSEVSGKTNIYLLYAIDLSGKIINQKQVDLSQIYKKLGARLSAKDLDQVFCKTALGLNEMNSQHYLYFGCSVPRDPEHNLPYGQKRGLTGIFLGIFLNNQNGHFDSKREPLFFSPSKITANPETGFNTGIYQAGAKAPLLEGNFILISTGNGPFIPKEDNYGCSMIILDGRDLKPAMRPAHFISQDDGSSNECFHSNTDFTSSAPVIKKIGDEQYVGTIKDKLGNVYFFNPVKLPVLPGRVLQSNAHRDLGINAMPSYAGGSLALENGNLISYSLVGSKKSYRSYLVYATAQTESNFIERGFKKNKCVGLLKKAGNRAAAIHTLYSGDVMRFNVVIHSMHIKNFIEQKFTFGPKLQKLVRHSVIDHKVPFADFGIAGYSPSSEDTVTGFKRVPIKIFFNLRMTSIPIIEEYQVNLGEESGYKYQENRHLVFDESGFVLIPENRTSCREYDPEKYVELNEYEMQVQNNYGHLLVKHQVLQENGALKIKKLWEIPGTPGNTPARAPLMLLTNKNKKQSFLVYNYQSSESRQHYLKVHDAESGKIIADFPVPGSMHFTHFIPHDKKLFYSSPEKGIIILR